ncbi:hypothetical protein Y032_0001g335 [Ancylostoma ceylanicum]|nr:hypothetical protein Y032_0001g335 [Ancylostoma ceylanicum]
MLGLDVWRDGNISSSLNAVGDPAKSRTVIHPSVAVTLLAGGFHPFIPKERSHWKNASDGPICVPASPKLHRELSTMLGFIENRISFGDLLQLQ